MSARLASLRRRLRGFMWPVPPEAEVDEEIAAHIELQTKRFMERGMSEPEARLAAVDRFGDVRGVRDECRRLRRQTEAEVRRAEVLHGLRMDAAFALRTFRRNPGFTVVAIFTIALGVGACTAIFSVMKSVLFGPLPYRHADRTVLLWNSYSPSALSHAAVSPPEFFDLRDQLRQFDALAAVRPSATTLAGDGREPERLTAYTVTPNVFDLLGARTLIGRGFGPDDGKGSSPPVVALSYALWRRRFGGDSAVIGRVVSVNGQPRTVSGVMSPEVRFPEAPLEFLRERAELWIPDDWERRRGDSRGNQILAVLARRRETSTLAEVRADLDAIAARFRHAYPDRYAPPAVAHWRLEAVSLHDQMVGSARPTLATMAGAVALLLLIACVNVANLLLARGVTRRPEMALRLALGADRRRLVRQLLTESTILAIAGGLFGVWLAWMGVEWLVRLGEGNLPRLEETRVDPLVIAFSVGVSLLTGLLIGLAPALQQSQTNLRTSLGEDARGGSDSVHRRRLRTSLAVAQIAMALVLLIAAGLLSRTFVELQRVNTGFTPDRVLAMNLSLPRFLYASDTTIAEFYQRLHRAVANTPGAEEIGGVYPLPMSGEGWSGTYTVEGEPTGLGRPLPHAEYAVVMPGYFRAMRIPVLAGREFTPLDVLDAPRVTIVDDRLAATHWPNQSALGKRIDVSGGLATIVGVVRHVHTGGPRIEGEPQIYQPHAQKPEPSMTIVIRASGRPADVVTSLRHEVRALDPNLPISHVRAMDDVVSSALSKERFSLVLLAVFALAALCLASVGLYGLMVYLVSQRTREIGIRIALGGQPRDVRWMVVRESFFISVSGLALGCAISLALSRVIDGLLYGVRPTDATTYAGVSLLMAVVAVAATYGPASRATRIDPAIALRD